ncbi:MAG: hypothetical protein M1428_03840 [Deltaproteobacteria bacterium]|nr:hypothetical protein [Deltaproteobacteria bacterium]
MKVKAINRYVRLIGLLALSGVMVVGWINCNNKSSSNSNGGGSGNNGTTPQTLTISGVLEQGTVNILAANYAGGNLKTANAPHLNASLSGLTLTPLTGYQLYCVTFSNPPAAGTGIADASGNVAVIFSATSTPFGCFVLDSRGNSVATVIFSSTTYGQTASFSGDANLGVIMVDLSNGVAQAVLPSNGTLVTTTPSGLPCPVGTWVSDMGPSPCAIGQDITSNGWIVQTPSGQYTVTFTEGPVFTNDGNCGTMSQSNIPATYSGGIVRISLNGDPNCTSKIDNFNITFNSSCTAGTITGSSVGCENCCGCTGDNSCSALYGDCSCSAGSTSSGCLCSGAGCTTEASCSGCGSLTCLSPAYSAVKQ